MDTSEAAPAVPAADADQALTAAAVQAPPAAPAVTLEKTAPVTTTSYSVVDPAAAVDEVEVGDTPVISPPRTRRRPAPVAKPADDVDELHQPDVDGPDVDEGWPGADDDPAAPEPSDFAGSDSRGTGRSGRVWRRGGRSDEAQKAPKKADSSKTTRDKKKDRADAVAFSAALGGRRRTQKAVQVALFGILLVVLAVGAVNILRPAPRVLSSAAITSIAQGAVQGTGFPGQAAETFAVRFAQTYYTWNGPDRDARLARTTDLAAYMPVSIDDGWDGKGVQSIVRGPFIAQETQSTDRNNGTVSLALQTDSGAWLYPQVMVWADDNGSLTVAATPVLGSAPERAAFPGNSASVTGDVDTAAGRAVQPVLTGFFTAWAAGDADALDRYLTQDATPQAQQGLAGAVQFGAISDVVVAAEDNSDGSRPATATVQWVYGDPAQPTSSTTTQTYRLTLVQESGQWSLRDIAAGTVGAGSG